MATATTPRVRKSATVTGKDATKVVPFLTTARGISSACASRHLTDLTSLVQSACHVRPILRGTELIYADLTSSQDR
jgi:hypothetical protein